MDLERTMQFIVEQQAQLTASVQKHDEQILKMGEHMHEIDEQMLKIEGRLVQSAELIHNHDQQIGSLTELLGVLAQGEIRLNQRLESMESRWSDRMEKMEASQQEMRVAMTSLAQRLDRFIQGLDGNGLHHA
jgi:chromosome segregation ATPase